MSNLLERLGEGQILVSDGALGTMLQAHGLPTGECPESWCVTHPDILRGIARAYVAAGSDLVSTNTFGANRHKLSAYGLETKVVEFNQAAVRLVREAVGPQGYVVGSIGPTGLIAEEEGGEASAEQFYAAFSEQVEALAGAGADAILIETMLSLVEARQAIKAAKHHTELPVLCTFTFEASGRGFRTMMGLTPQDTAQGVLEAGGDVVGANCGNGIDAMIEIARQLRAAAPRAPVLIQPNAGLPVLEGDKTVFTETPDYMASRVAALIAAGTNIIGGCCGTTPEHIAAMTKIIRRSQGI